MDKGKILIGFSVALFSSVITLKDTYFLVGCILVGFLLITSSLLLSKERLPKRLKNEVEQFSMTLDISWVSLGLGLGTEVGWI